MKKLLKLLTISLSIITFAFPFAPKKVSADSGYLRVITADTPFYSSETDTEPLFFLPYTYYVRILKETLNFYHVEYCAENGMLGIDGYVPKDMLFDDGLSAETRYPEIYLTTSSSTVLYSDKELTLSEQYVFSGRKLSYYGQYLSPSGEVIFFVRYNNRLGYVTEEAVVPFTVPDHPNPLTFIPEPEPETPEEEPTITEKSTYKGETLRYLIIGCLAFAGIIALVIAFKNKPQRAVNGYYEENEYE